MILRVTLRFVLALQAALLQAWRWKGRGKVKDCRRLPVKFSKSCLPKRKF